MDEKLKHKLDLSKNMVLAKEGIQIAYQGIPIPTGLEELNFIIPRASHFEVNAEFDEYFFTVEYGMS